MNVLILLSLHSAFEKSLVERVWQPTGSPALAKLLAAFEGREGDQLQLIFLGKQPAQAPGLSDTGAISLVGLGARTRYIPPIRRLPWPFARLRWYFSEIRQAWKMWRIYKAQKPDLIYVDRGNVFVAAMFARLTGTPVVLRVLGIPPSIRSVISGRRPFDIMNRWAFRSPFSCVICSQDGTGPELWLERLIATGVSRHLWINGVDPIEDVKEIDRTLALPPEKTKVMFVGRLEPDKGCVEFIKGFLLAFEEEPTNIHAVVVGSGSLEQTLRDAVSASNAGDAVTFVGRLPYNQVIATLREADIYVSLNRHGNLSNANLEAMQIGCCMVIPKSQPETGADLETDRLMPDDTVFRIPSADDIGALSKAILRLHRNPDERRDRGQATRAKAASFIRSWDDRIAEEISILESLVEKSSKSKQSKLAP